MKEGLSYLFLLLTLSCLLFWTLANHFGTNTYVLDYLLAMIVTHLILEKNPWLAELLYKKHKKNEVSLDDRLTDEGYDEFDHSKVTSIRKKNKGDKRFNEFVQNVQVGEKFDIHYNKNRYLIRQTKNGYILTREMDGYTQVFKTVDDLFRKGKIDNKYVKDIIDQVN
ncbi:hypothetical protein SAMN05877753_102573 [Bacillus oleivorans]|uniref:Uncharacterized protein n=1 Tax=Bacillus oleivorans TaxID=1448271 RepID=A0A285CLU5_9BACI|nr:hypothetical protein [Bacillus oleivorans]SNX68521.1 hypothetical protein SAMN05877753_102573 [Bacillus oleivorans]